MAVEKLSVHYRIKQGVGKHQAIVDATISKNCRLTLTPGHLATNNIFDFKHGSNPELVKNIAKAMLEGVKLAEKENI